MPEEKSSLLETLEDMLAYFIVLLSIYKFLKTLNVDLLDYVKGIYRNIGRNCSSRRRRRYIRPKKVPVETKKKGRKSRRRGPRQRINIENVW